MPQVKITSDCTILVEFRADINPEINQQVHALTELLSTYKQSDRGLGIFEITPSYHTVQVSYDALILDPHHLTSEIERMLNNLHSKKDIKKKVITVPVCYEMPYGPDLKEVCQITGLSKTEVISRHTEREYLIYMLGFTPGFPYLGGMDKTIAAPRRTEPRLKIDAGSVGIAGEQTGIYPVESPGGWQIIGRTPLKLFDPSNKEAFLLQAGQYIKFESISKETYERIRKHGNA